MKYLSKIVTKRVSPEQKWKLPKRQAVLLRPFISNINLRKAKEEDAHMFEGYDEILTVAEVMEILYVGKNTVYHLLNRGELKAFRIGKTWKIPKACLEEFIIRKNQ